MYKLGGRKKLRLTSFINCSFQNGEQHWAFCYLIRSEILNILCIYEWVAENNFGCKCCQNGGWGLPCLRLHVRLLRTFPLALWTLNAGCACDWCGFRWRVILSALMLLGNLMKSRPAVAKFIRALSFSRKVHRSLAAHTAKLFAPPGLESGMKDKSIRQFSTISVYSKKVCETLPLFLRGEMCDFSRALWTGDSKRFNL